MVLTIPAALLMIGCFVWSVNGEELEVGSIEHGSDLGFYLVVEGNVEGGNVVR